jgi:hypothetical protein
MKASEGRRILDNPESLAWFDSEMRFENTSEIEAKFLNHHTRGAL